MSGVPLPADVAGIDKAAVASRFSRSAATYDDHCRVQRLLAHRLIGRLGGAAPTRVLELGCGTGYLTGLLASCFPGSAILAIDFADGMVDVARERVGGAGVRFEVADAETAWFAPGAFDLIVSNATIQWFDAPAPTLARLAGCLEPGGLMLHSTFGPGTFTELRSVLQQAGPREAGLHLRPAGEWLSILAGAGLDPVEGGGVREVVRYRTASDFLAELHATGATWRPSGEGTARLPPGLLRRTLDRYDAELGTAEGVPVTYELVEVSGFRPAENHLKGKQK